MMQHGAITASLNREKVECLQTALNSVPQVDCPVRHYFAPGVILPRDVTPEHADKVRSAFDLSAVHQADDWISRCASDTAQLWNADDFWGITEVVQAKTGRALHIVAVAGLYAPALFESMEAWGKAIGCKTVYFTGRKGWAKRMASYTLKTITMEKRL